MELLWYLALALFQSVVEAQYDPLKNYCKLLDHQSIVFNNTLYIDGGKEVFINVNGTGAQYGNRTIGPNNYMFTVDLSESWDWTNNISLKANEEKSNAPQLARGALYPDPSSSSNFYLFGGSTPLDNQSFFGQESPLPAADSLWSYDTTKDEWKSYNMSKYGLTRPASGADAYVPDLGLAFWYNGMQDNGSAVETEMINDTTLFLGGMTVLDLHNQSARNLSTKAVSSKARVRGQMVHVPLPGSDGILVLIGGGEKPNTNTEHDWKGTLVSTGTIDVFDVGSLKNSSTPDGVWYSQPASGSPPDPRLDACLVVAAAPDNSSYNIYMYGGRNGLAVYYDEVWVLSLPSFQWKKLYQGQAPRYSMTCHLVGNRQLITVGGSDTSHLTDDKSNCDWQTKMVEVLDLTDISWSSKYNAYAAPYEVPTEVVKMIGGTSTGGATIQPAGGFSDPRLAALFNPPKSTSNTTSNPTSSPSSAAKHTSNAGAIAGGVLGGLAGLALILVGILFLLRRIKRNRSKEPKELESQQAQVTMSGGQEVFEKHGEDVSELPSYQEGAGLFKKPTLNEHPVELSAGEIEAHRRKTDEIKRPSEERP